MARVSVQAEQLARKGVDFLVKMYRTKQPQQWQKMVQIVENEQQFMRVYAIGSLPTATAVNEATGTTFSDFQTPWSLDVQKVKRSIGFSVSTEAKRRDLYRVLADRDAMMGRSIIKAEEYDISSFMNLATLGGTNFVCPDGVAWFSKSHLTATGTYSNILSTNAALGPGSFAQALSELRQQPDHTGDPMNYTEPVDLWVAPYNEDLAYRMQESHGYPTTPNNDPNYSGRRIANIVVNPYFTNPAQWAIVIRGERNPFVYVLEEEPRLETDYEISHDVYNCVMYALWGKAMVDARGAVLSQGL